MGRGGGPDFHGRMARWSLKWQRFVEGVPLISWRSYALALRGNAKRPTFRQ